MLRELKMDKLCYVLNKRPVGAYATIYNSTLSRRAVIAFQNHDGARRFLRLAKEMMTLESDIKKKTKNTDMSNRKDQEDIPFMEKIIINVLGQDYKVQGDICVQPIVRTTLSRRCTLNGLDLIMFNNDGSYYLDKTILDMDDYLFHLENCVKYYD